MDKKERDKKYSGLINEYFKKAQSSDEIDLDGNIEFNLRRIFSSSARGFREILLVIILAKKINREYNAYESFYDCNPRAIYEGPIRGQLDEWEVPRGKSGPLNVAKATKGINETWAAQRRPKEVADSIVFMVKTINGSKPEDFEKIAIRIHQEFLKKAQEAKHYVTKGRDYIDPYDMIADILSFIYKATDRGNTPQKICGFILYCYHQSIGSQIEIEGLSDEACTTNTTSKKPADISEFLKGGGIHKAYEISIKYIDMNRLQDSWESINDYNSKTQYKITEIVYLCRIKDAVVLDKIKDDLIIGATEYKDILFNFIDINRWIELMVVSMLNNESRKALFDLIDEYVSHKDTHFQVKKIWKLLNYGK